MVGAAVNVIPFMIQRQVPGIGPNVLPAYLLAAVPAVLAGLAYAMLASAMPRAGGSYVFASRALSPYLGFVASFSQWFSLSVVMGVVSFLITPVPARHRRGAAVARAWRRRSNTARCGWPSRWACCGRRPALNLLGIKAYERLMVPLMFLTFALGSVVIVAGFSYRPRRLRRGAAARDGGRRVRDLGAADAAPAVDDACCRRRCCSSPRSSASTRSPRPAAKRGARRATCRWRSSSRSAWWRCSTSCSPRRCTTPRRGQYVAAEAQRRDVTAPGLLGVVLPPFWTVVIVSSAVGGAHQGSAGDAARACRG